MKGINFNQRPTPIARGSSRAPCENSTKRMWGLVLTVSVPSSFSVLMLLGVCCDCLCPSRGFVLRSPLELIIMPTARMAALPTSVSCRQPDLSVQYHPWSKVDIRGQPHLSHSMGREQGWGHLRATTGFGVFWFIPPLLSKPIFGQPPL